jgi:RND family efflux transporter MFP subunit
MSFEFTPRTRLGAGVAVLVAVLAAAFFLLRPAAQTPALAEQAPPAAPEPAQVTVMTAKLVKMAPRLALPGTVVARSDSHLASEVEGRVASVAEVGDVVNAGDVVARIDTTSAGLQLASDKANAARLAAQLRFDREQADRMQKLFADNAIARSTRDQAVSTRDMDVAALAQAQAAYNKSQFIVDHSQIRAPFPGRVAARLINPGEYATPGKDIVRLVDIGSIEVKAQAPIEDAHFLHEGLALTVTIQNRPVTATVRAIVPVGDELSRTIEVRLSLPAGAALVGDAAKVYVPTAEPRDVLAVPRDALVLREDNTYVFTIGAKSEAQRVAVETGSEDGPLVEVHGRIAAGQQVIVRGAERLEAGQKVRAVQAS